MGVGRVKSRRTEGEGTGVSSTLKGTVIKSTTKGNIGNMPVSTDSLTESLGMP